MGAALTCLLVTVLSEGPIFGRGDMGRREGAIAGQTYMMLLLLMTPVEGGLMRHKHVRLTMITRRLGEGSALATTLRDSVTIVGACRIPAAWQASFPASGW